VVRVGCQLRMRTYVPYTPENIDIYVAEDNICKALFLVFCRLFAQLTCCRQSQCTQLVIGFLVQQIALSNRLIREKVCASLLRYCHERLGSSSAKSANQCLPLLTYAYNNLALASLGTATCLLNDIKMVQGKALHYTEKRLSIDNWKIAQRYSRRTTHPNNSTKGGVCYFS
jgi:hypothetical protein